MLFKSVMMHLAIVSVPVIYDTEVREGIPTLTALYCSCHMSYEIVHITKIILSLSLSLSLLATTCIQAESQNHLISSNSVPFTLYYQFCRQISYQCDVCTDGSGILTRYK